MTWPPHRTGLPNALTTDPSCAMNYQCDDRRTDSGQTLREGAHD
jgi:hypothetical protein